MAAQPANTTIKIHQNVRTYRQMLRNDSVEAITKHLRPLVVSVPGDEILSGVLTRNTSLSDFSPYMGQAAAGATRGFPVVVGVKDTVSFAELQGVDGVAAAFKVGGDQFVHLDDASLDNDLFADVSVL